MTRPPEPEGSPFVDDLLDGRDRLLTPAEFAALMRVDAKTVSRWAKAGRISSVRTAGGHRRFRESVVRGAARRRHRGGFPVIAAERDWRVDAACAGVDPEVFFAADNAALTRARRVCAACPVRDACREWADSRGIVDGFWAGETQEERRTRLAGGPRPAATLAVCPQCRHGYPRRRKGQQFCSHSCANLAKVLPLRQGCGTTAAARRHRKRGERLDDACRKAETRYRAGLRERTGPRRRHRAVPA